MQSSARCTGKEEEHVKADLGHLEEPDAMKVNHTPTERGAV